MPEALERLLTSEDVAEVLGVSTKTLSEWCCRRIVAHCKIGGRLRFRSKDVTEFIERNRVVADTGEEA